MDFVNYVNGSVIKKNNLGIFWLGQAGFIIKTHANKLIAIDPYLSDCCLRLYNFKRIMPSLIQPRDLVFDYLLISHEHEDHLDIDSVVALTDNNKTKLYGPIECIKRTRALGVQDEKLVLVEIDQEIDLGEFKLLPVFADHGELSPDAVGFLLNFGFVKVYYAGDTSYSLDKLRKIISIEPEIAILPINGQYGNLNAQEAASLANILRSKVMIPCHFWTFVQHGGYPAELFEAMKELAPGCELQMLSQGEMYLYRGEVE